jgi:hypothetical protein
MKLNLYFIEDLKISTTWMRTEWRGKIRYEVRIFPFRIGQSEALTVFESFVVVVIFL